MVWEKETRSLGGKHKKRGLGTPGGHPPKETKWGFPQRSEQAKKKDGQKENEKSERGRNATKQKESRDIAGEKTTTSRTTKPSREREQRERKTET